MKQTAVEWLVDELLSGNPLMPSLIEQAISMEKQQIVNAHLIGLIRPLEIEATKQAEHYYTQEYGNETTQELE